ncbi:serine/threonine protein phosphatase 1 [Raineyella antarctica]|uniref:Serine/threonine protein phosphatase 1 n=1 Tax=Raineyella antarctica TaxID=1577474 RepID=A0A1G6HGB0_9ACTN|nr:metallophosphoesterase [Raineyella antarctica]SDB93289.1 serine/threonine protein phosphatase 1 [Raineyella antarctica]
MSTEIAFVGDVHGNLYALLGLCDVLAELGDPHTVFLGDYVNKGAHTAEVMQELLTRWQTGGVTLLRGNHEDALVDALDTGDLRSFLKMGGAMTIRSYVGGEVGPDVLKDFQAKFPREHLDALRRMPETFETDVLIAQHSPASTATSKFRISGHVPVSTLPRIGQDSAQLDTGCGAEDGRLTALLWPSLDFVQVDAHGAIVVR